jgi:hypothetical protein
MSIFFSCAVDSAQREPIRLALQDLDPVAASLGLSSSLVSLGALLEGSLASGELKPDEDLEKILLLSAVAVNLGPENNGGQLLSLATAGGDSIALTTAKECDAFLTRLLDVDQYNQGLQILIALGVLPKPLDLTSFANAFEGESVFCL